MTEHLTKAIVLDKQLIGEADARVVVYTQELGRVELIAKGLKKITSKFGHHLEPLTMIDCLVLINRHHHLKGVLAENSYLKIKKNEIALSTALKCLHLTNKVIIMPEKDEVLWRKLIGFLDTLDSLAEKDDVVSIRLAGIFFLIRLAERGGFQPEIGDFKNKLEERDFSALKEILSKPIFSKIDLKYFKNSNLDNIEKKLMGVFEELY